MWLWFYQILGVLGRLECVLVQLTKRRTIRIPFLITFSIPDLAKHHQNLACLPSMWRGGVGSPTFP
jgi:hypothetical protein